MSISTVNGDIISGAAIEKYFRSLVDRFFKILPMREENEPSCDSYIASLQKELLGCKSLMKAIDDDPAFISLIAVLQYLMDNPDLDLKSVKHEVFKAISICNKLAKRYSDDKEVVPS